MNIQRNSGNTKALSIFCLALSFMGATITLASAETFSIGGTALNTNNQFPLKDGQPIMSTWTLNPTDNDQQFDRLSGNLLRHKSTNKCLNAYQPAAGSVVNVYPCNANDGDQKFSLIPVGNNTNLIQRMGTNFCLDMPSRSSNLRIMLQNCNTGNTNQKFVSDAGSANNQSSQAKINSFINAFQGTRNIQRYDYWNNSDYQGQCVTLIARYLQEYYGASRSSLTLGHGKNTAANIANQFSQSFLPVSDPSNPIPGSIMSFPSLGGSYGHVALVVSSQRNGNTLSVTILDSNGDNLALQGTSMVTRRNITVNAINGVSPTHGNGIYWTNPKN
jgi:Ricin-type beta-trefoil lectin domain/CHAP domain